MHIVRCTMHARASISKEWISMAHARTLESVNVRVSVVSGPRGHAHTYTDRKCGTLRVRMQRKCAHANDDDDDVDDGIVCCTQNPQDICGQLLAHAHTHAQLWMRWSEWIKRFGNNWLYHSHKMFNYSTIIYAFGDLRVTLCDVGLDCYLY